MSGIFPLIKTIGVKLHFSPTFYKETRLMSYKHIMNHSYNRFTIFILYYIHIFRASL